MLGDTDFGYSNRDGDMHQVMGLLAGHGNMSVGETAVSLTHPLEQILKRGVPMLRALGKNCCLFDPGG